MAVTKQQMQNAINSYKKQGKTDNEIIIALSKRKDTIGLSFADDMKHGTVEEFAEVFGLKYDRSPVNVNNAVNKNATLWDKTKDTAQSFAVGVADTTGNVAKGFYGLTDKVGLTKGAKEQYQKDVKNMNQEVKASRTNAGRSGVDLARLGGNMVATAPMAMVGSGLGLGARMGVQGALGVAGGAMHYSDSDKMLKQNMLLGGLGGAGGEALGAGLGYGVGKVYNASKGAKKGEANAIEALGKQFDVPVSAGDLSRNAIIQKSEVLTEKMPVVGMNKWRANQNVKAKTAGQNVVDNFKNKLDETEYKYLDKLQADAGAGNRNAKRVLEKLEKAQTTDEIIQVSLEARKYRENKVASNLYARVDDELAKVGHDTVTPTKTLSLMSGKIEQLKKSLAPDDDFIKELSKIESRLLDPNIPKSFGNMRELRSQLGDLADKYAVDNKSASRYFGDLRQAVVDDIDEFIANSGNANIKTAYQRADSFYKNMLTGQDKQIARAMDSNKPDEIYSAFVKTGRGDRAKNFYQALDPKGQSALRFKMAEEALSKSVDEQTGHFSPAVFAREFDKLSVPYQHIFHGADKKEMDGFVKLMRHIERAGQYMENPATGNRVGDMAIGAVAISNLPMLAKAGGVTLFAKTMFTTKAGKNLLLASSKLPPESQGLANILNYAQKLTTSASREMAIQNSDEQADNAFETSDVVAVEPLPPTTQQPPIQPPNLADLSLPPQDTSYLEKLGQPIDIGGMPTPSNMPSGPVDFGGDVGNTGENVGYGENPEYGGVSGDYQNTGYQAVAEPKSQVALGNIAQGLYDLIPPPKETDNPRKQAVFEQFASSMVGRVLDTPQLQKIVDEFDNDEPNLRKIKALQKQLEKTPEWQSLLNTMPKEQRKHGSEILQYLTNGQIHDNSGMFNPTF